MVSSIRPHCCKSGFKSPISPPYFQPGVTFKNGAPFLLGAGTKPAGDGIRCPVLPPAVHLPPQGQFCHSPLQGTGMNLSPVACVDLRKEATPFRIKESGDTKQGEGWWEECLDPTANQNTGCIYTRSLLSAWMLVGSAAYLPACLMSKIMSLENEASFW